MQESSNEVRYLRAQVEDAKRNVGDYLCHPLVLRLVAGAREFDASIQHEEIKSSPPPPPLP